MLQHSQRKTEVSIGGHGSLVAGSKSSVAAPTLPSGVMHWPPRFVGGQGGARRRGEGALRGPRINEDGAQPCDVVVAVVVIEDTNSDDKKLSPKVTGAEDLDEGLANDVCRIVKGARSDGRDDKMLDTILAGRSKDRPPRLTEFLAKTGVCTCFCLTGVPPGSRGN